MYWKVEYVLLIIASTLVDYYAGLQIYQSRDHSRKKKFLLLSLCINLGLLFFFKYTDFILENIHLLIGWPGVSDSPTQLNLILPIGISFYTFQTLSYTIDIYRGELKPERHLGYFALYVSFFPQLIAGPIEKAKNLIPQLKRKIVFEYENAREGMILIAWGVFKKIVIADRIALVIEPIYAHPHDFHGVAIALAAMLFMIQVYCDFSGYSDIAIGTARIIGIRLSLNFKNSFFSKSIGELWSKWHITLMDWFKSYVYIPLGGSRGSRAFGYRNILIVFALSGLWHGADWNVVSFGLVNGAYIVLEKMTYSFRVRIANFIGLDKIPNIHKAMQIAITFLLFSISGLFFRAESIYDTIVMIQNLWSANFLSLEQYSKTGIWHNIILIPSILLLFSTERLLGEETLGQFLSQKKLLIRWLVYILLIGICVNFGITGEQEFVYFQF
ncbi:MAG: MBOAT family O-acyltransferase [Reichenbachiella sp.]|uniref:MBOAT family O-acyltransferase n=1 Tax=Reichenbachiella sp. TaxID=2184521 RepID=UPI003265DA5C